MYSLTASITINNYPSPVLGHHLHLTMFQIQISQCPIVLQLVFCVFIIDNIIEDNEPLGHSRRDLVRKQELDHAGHGHQHADQWHSVAAPKHWAHPEAADGAQPLTASSTSSGHHTWWACHPQHPQDYARVTSVSCTKSATPLPPSVPVSWTQHQSLASPSPSQVVSGHLPGALASDNIMFPPILTLAPEILLLWNFRWPKIWTMFWTMFPQTLFTVNQVMNEVLNWHRYKISCLMSDPVHATNIQPRYT